LKNYALIGKLKNLKIGEKDRCAMIDIGKWEVRSREKSGQ